MLNADTESDVDESTAPVRARPDGPRTFALVALVLAVAAGGFALFAAVTADGSRDRNEVSERGDTSRSRDDNAVADPNADPAVVIADAAAAMAQVTSVEFELARTQAPIFIDQFESIALDSMLGQFTVPSKAAARLKVTINGDVSTYIGAIALGDEVWTSNPVTGNFETLPAGYDIDPSKFFDPTGGWQPLLASLTDVELIAIDDRGGQRYHLRGVAPAAEVTNITVGLVRDQEVTIDLWVHPDSKLVTAAEFSTVSGGATTSWELNLSRYGEQFTIEPPADVRPADVEETG